MKKSIFLLVFLLGFVLVGCNKPKEDPKIILSSTSISLEVGDTYDIKPDTKALLGAKVLYSSSDETVVTVSSSGKVTALKKGSASIEVSLEGYKDIKKVINVTVTGKLIIPPELEEQLTVSGPTEVKVGETIQLVAVDTLDVDGYGVLWVAKNNDIAKVNQQGVVTGVKAGVATFEIHSKENAKHISFEITVLPAIISELTVKANINDEKIKTTANLILSVTPVPAAANKEVVWTSDDERIAVVGENGAVTIAGYGEVTFTATSVENSEIFDTYTVEIYWDIMDFLDYVMVDEVVMRQQVTFLGYQPEVVKEDILGSVTNFLFRDYPKFEKIAPIANNRPGTLKPSTEFITVHDTASSAASATAMAHANYVYNGGGGTSWHFSIGDDGVWYQIPIDEVAYHAGDGSRFFKLIDTGVKVTSKIKPAQGVSSDGYFTLNGEKTVILAPWNTYHDRMATTADINDYGVHIEIGSNGNWWMNEAWFAEQGFNRIGNSGGNRNSVGIETMINKGSDIYLTWHYTAKKASELALHYDLEMDRIVTHHHFTGKPCPNTMRTAGLYPQFRKMIEAEYLMQKLFSDYSFEFTSNNPDILNEYGHIIKVPNQTTTVSYLIKVTNSEGFNKSKVYFADIPSF